MKDASGGLQSFLFSWLRLPRTPVMTTRGDEAEVYLENLAPLFFIDQNEGWTDLQALQVYRYGLQDIAQVAVEYLLGAVDALRVRVARQAIAALESKLKGAAEGLAAQIAAVFSKQGWIIDWSARGSVTDIVRRWSIRTLPAVARDEFRFDIDVEQPRLRKRAEALREVFGRGKLDPMNMGAASDVSQGVVEIKERRHMIREELRRVRSQWQDQQLLAEGLEHRIHSAKDVLRLKRDGIGRLEAVECPTCHRTLDPLAFELTLQSTKSVEANIEALSRDRLLVVANIESAQAQATRLAAELARVEEQLRSAERALATVNAAVGSVREQLARAAVDLATTEGEIEKNATVANELVTLQSAVDAWLREARTTSEAPNAEGDLAFRREAFDRELQSLLCALGHSAVTGSGASVHVDDNYVPYLGPRRLRSLGSASDHSRLVAAYTLALAKASLAVGGPHPGFVLLDEPLQQNPDAKHRELLLHFLKSGAASHLRHQTIIFTWFRDDEVVRLQGAGVRVEMPRGEHFLKRTNPITSSSTNASVGESGDDGPAPWAVEARAAAERALETAKWDYHAKVVTLYGEKILGSRNELKDELIKYYNEQWYTNVSFDGGETMFEDDAEDAVENLLGSVTDDLVRMGWN